MSKSVSAIYTAPDGVALDVEVGFVPDHVKLTIDLGAAELVYDWYKIIQSRATATGAAVSGQYAILDTAGTKSTPTTAATGIIALSSDDVGVLINSPKDSGEQVFVGDVSDWEASTAYTPARTATAVGDVIRPTVHNNYVYELTTAGTTDSTEPTFPTNPGDTVTDNTAVWTCRDQNVTKRGVNGFQVGATVNVNGDICVYEATQNDRSRDQGDGDDTNPIRL
jgi:hypothetical protein